jgi:hypothetical protein
MINAITAQIDDPDAAVAEICGQVAEKKLRKNSVGLLACSYEFIDAGTVEALQNALPFDLVGITTLGNAAKGLYGLDYLSVSVLTSDDVCFSTSATGPITEKNMGEEIAGAFNRAKAALGSHPDFVLAYPPIMLGLGGALFFKEINSLAGDVPVFGTASCDQTMDFRENKVIFKGKASREFTAFVLMKGDIHPRFLVTAIPNENIQKQHAVVTDSEGTLVKKVNGMPILEYLKDLGLASDGKVEVMSSVPLMVDYHDGTKPVAMGIYGFTPEGCAVCAGDVPVDSSIAIGILDYESIMKTAETSVSKFLGYGDINGILMYPCLTRNMLLGINGTDEMKKIISLLGDKIPYQIVYSGGEMCPMKNTEGSLVNHFHNFTFIACIL